MPSLIQIGHALASPERQLQVLSASGAPDFDEHLERQNLAPLETDETIEVLQVNVGKLCNQTCSHCHVDAGPDRGEMMGHETAEQVIELLRLHPIPTLDITGGAPELNPNFRFLVKMARMLGRRVIDRSNLTILLVPSQADLAEFLAEHRVEIVASLPCYEESNTDSQRGQGVFKKSIEALRRLNALGYGQGGELRLSLAHNPVGATLPANQNTLERDYRRELEQRHGVVFDELYTITNMPISRFLEYLERNGDLERYMELLVGSFNVAAARQVMCRSYISVGWDGTIYDCDFNQMLEMPVDHGAPATLSALVAAGTLGRRVRTARHCFGCTAGAGSSCTGAAAS